MPSSIDASDLTPQMWKRKQKSMGAPGEIFLNLFMGVLKTTIFSRCLRGHPLRITLLINEKASCESGPLLDRAEGKVSSWAVRGWKEGASLLEKLQLRRTINL